MAGLLATRLSGSSDLYKASNRTPRHSINFVTCHDGFTLWDQVSYNEKHNEANGEDNLDGNNANYSWNCGVEGPTVDPQILALRRRQAKNLMTTLMLTQGVPMLQGGDEFLRTQQGNNNAWCQDNEISWVDWSLAEHNADFLRFVRLLIALRRRHPALRRRTFFHGSDEGSMAPDIIWHGVEAQHPDFSAASRTVAYSLDGQQTGREPDRDFYVAINAWQDHLDFHIPRSPSGRSWHRAIDTVLPSPKDIVGLDEGPLVPAGGSYPVAGRSVLVLVSEG
jgi:isoamylase